MYVMGWLTKRLQSDIQPVYMFFVNIHTYIYFIYDKVNEIYMRVYAGCILILLPEEDGHLLKVVLYENAGACSCVFVSWKIFSSRSNTSAVILYPTRSWAYFPIFIIWPG